MKHLDFRKPYLTGCLILSIPVIGFSALTVMSLRAYVPAPEFYITFSIFAAMLLLFLWLLYHRITNYPLRIEYDETVIHSCCLRKTKTIYKTRDIYLRKIYAARAVTYEISNTPYPATDMEVIDSLSWEDVQVLITDCHVIPWDKHDWTVMLKEYADTPAPPQSELTVWLSPNRIRHTLGVFMAIPGAAFFAWMLYAFKNDMGPLLLMSLELIPIVLLYMGVFIYMLSKLPEHFIKVHLQNNTATSSLWGKPLCTVDFTKPVYYAVLRANKYAQKPYPYAIISNERFNYYVVNNGNKSYLDKYDKSREIVMPISNATAAYCDFDNWHCVGGFGELNMKRSKD